MFFAYETALPQGVGFSLYSLPHIAALAVIILSCIFCSIAYRRTGQVPRQHISHAIGITILLMEILRTVVYHFMGGMNLYELPLHLCGMAVFLCAVHSLWKPDWLGQVLYSLCLPGAWAALLFPDWAMYPFFSFVSLHSFAAHGLIVLYITLQTASGEIRPRLSAVWKPVLFLCIVVPPVMWFDRRFHANYMFLQLPSAGSPLVFLSELAGGSLVGYLFLFAVTIFCVMVIMDLPFAVRKRKRRL
ncbi:MAG: TIGR02206 family membrane protein [Eubacteriales bacterium]|nr:TIGR02206 family membrane protein [Eubacteriales bacterium]